MISQIQSKDRKSPNCFTCDSDTTTVPSKHCNSFSSASTCDTTASDSVGKDRVNKYQTENQLISSLTHNVNKDNQSMEKDPSSIPSKSSQDESYHQTKVCNLFHTNPSSSINPPPPPPPPCPPRSGERRKSKRSLNYRSSSNGTDLTDQQPTLIDTMDVCTFQQDQTAPTTEDFEEDGIFIDKERLRNDAQATSTDLDRNSLPTNPTTRSWKALIPSMTKASHQLDYNDSALSSAEISTPFSHLPDDRNASSTKNFPSNNNKSKDAIESVYYGGQMNIENANRTNVIELHPVMLKIERRREMVLKETRFDEKKGWLLRSGSMYSYKSKDSRNMDADSLADFDVDEWTPPDSSYGAAIPFGGWIPKHIRRMIESSLIALGMIVLVYFVVTTSMKLSDDHNRHNSTSVNHFSSDGSDEFDYLDGNLYLDDDYYVVRRNASRSNINKLDDFIDDSSFDDN